MEVINKAHEDSKRAKSTWQKATIFFSTETIRFSGYLCEQAGIKTANEYGPMYVHFVADLDRLYFYVNNNILGYKVTARPSGKGYLGLICYSAPGIRMLENNCPVLKRKRHYLVRKSVLHANEYELWEVLLHKKVK